MRRGAVLYLMVLLFALSAEGDCGTKRFPLREFKIGNYTYKSYFYKKNNMSSFLIFRGKIEVFSEAKSGGEVAILSLVDDSSDGDREPVLKDFNADGVLDLVLEQLPGKYRSKYRYWIFSMGRDLKLISRFESYLNALEFEDLDQDGICELQCYDYNFLGWQTENIGLSPPKVIMHLVGDSCRIARDLMQEPIPKFEDFEEWLIMTRELWGDYEHPVGKIKTDYSFLVEYLKAKQTGQDSVKVRVNYTWSGRGVPSAAWMYMQRLIYAGQEKAAWDFLELLWPADMPGKIDFLIDFNKRLLKSPYFRELGIEVDTTFSDTMPIIEAVTEELDQQFTTSPVISTQLTGPKLYWIVVEGKSGYMDYRGQVIIPPQFEWASDFSEGLASVKLNGKWGYISHNGEMVVPARFQWASPFHNGRARIRINDRWTFINKTGDYLLRPIFDWVGNFSEHLAPIRSGGKFSYIDTSGNLIYRTNLIWAGDFSESFATIAKPVDRKVIYGLMHVRGGEYFEEPFSFRISSFSEGLAPIRSGPYTGYIDKDGKTIIESKFLLGGGFSDGLARVYLDIPGKCGYIDLTGNMVIDTLFDWSEDFSEGLAAAVKDGKFGYIDKKGSWVIAPSFDKGHGFSGGLAMVEVNGKLGYIDKRGVYVWEPSR